MSKCAFPDLALDIDLPSLALDLLLSLNIDLPALPELPALHCPLDEDDEA